MVFDRHIMNKKLKGIVNMQTRIGILYICTGPYYLFWEDFYNTFEKNFLPNIQKNYFVFTDAEKIYCENNKNIQVYRIINQPWPLITLLRFNTFLTIEEELKKYDYLMFSNANIVCNKVISEKEFLPRESKCEDIFVTSHPGYYKKSPINFPYERNPKSLAYIPWNCGKDYVIGAMFGGTSRAFIQMSKTLKYNIEEDLKKNIIAKWHDESHLNRYIIKNNNVRILSPQYCYPYGINVAYEKRISAVSKQDKFDVKKFKGQYKCENNISKKIVIKIKKTLCLKEKCLFLKDSILHKTIKRI